MLPSIKVSNPRPNRNRPRPISNRDTAASTGLASNPNGTYVANSYPTTAQNGMQGQFGAMLPTVKITGGGLPMMKNMWEGVTPGYNSLLPSNTAFNNSVNPFVNASGVNLNPYAAYQYRGEIKQSKFAPTFEGKEKDDLYDPSPTPHSGSFSQAAAMAGVLSRLEMGDMSVISQIPKADLEAMGLGELAAAVTGGTGEPTDFQQTEAFKYNQANQIPLTAQKRWDEKKRKYITVGEWMRQERRKYNRKGKYVGDKAANRKRAQQQAAAEQPASDGEYHGTIQQIGVVNFNTATG